MLHVVFICIIYVLFINLLFDVKKKVTDKHRVGLVYL